jgi:hypothetical protein
MANPVLLQSSYDLGIRKDEDRHMLPKGSVWNMVDYLTGHGPPLKGRGCWLPASPELDEGAATSIPAVAWAPFAAGGQLVAISSNTSLWKVDSAVSATDKGNATIPAQRPVFFANLLVIPGSNGATTPFKYDGSAAPGSLGGTPPQGVLADVHKGRLILARTAANPRRVWWSGPGDPQVWDTTNGYMDMSRPVTGLAALRSSLLVYSTSGVEAIRGDKVPPAKEVERVPLFEQGTSDPASIVKMGDQVVWANQQGIWQSDGSVIDDLTVRCGASRFWRDMMASYDASSWTLGAGTIHGLYVISVLQGGTTAETLAIDVERKTWFRISNLPAKMFAEKIAASPELYFGWCGGADVQKVGAISNYWLNAFPDEADHLGSGPTPVFETVYFRGRPGSRRVRNLWLGLDYTVDTISGGEYITLDLVRAPGDTSYDSVEHDNGDTFKIFPDEGGYRRVKVPLNFKGDGFGLKVTVTGAIEDVAVYDIEAEISEQETSK